MRGRKEAREVKKTENKKDKRWIKGKKRKYIG